MNLLFYYENNDAEVPKITSELFVVLFFLHSVKDYNLRKFIVKLSYVRPSLCMSTYFLSEDFTIMNITNEDMNLLWKQ